MSGDIESRLTKKLSQEFNGTKSRLLSGSFKLDDFFLNPQVWAKSGSGPGTFQNSDTENQEPNEDSCQNDPRPEVGTSIYRSPLSRNSDPKKASYSARTTTKWLLPCALMKEWSLENNLK